MGATSMISAADGATHQNPRTYVSFQDVTLANNTSYTLTHHFDHHRYGTFTRQNIVWDIAMHTAPAAGAASLTPFMAVANMTASHGVLTNPAGGPICTVRVYATALHSVIE